VQLRASEAARGAKPELVDAVIAADAEWRKVEFEVNQLNKAQNALSKEIGAKKKAKENADELIAKVAANKKLLAEKDEQLKVLHRAVQVKMRMVGNLVHESVPVSKDEAQNEIVKTWGTCTRDHAKYHHHELLHMIDGYASERGVTVAGHRGYFLKGVGVLLNQALIQYGLSFLVKRQYTPLQPPYFMRKEVMAETAQLEEFDEALYHVTGTGEDLYLIATSEQPISAYHRDEVLERAQLPLRYGGLSTCFRKEAGSHGRDTWGIFRIHQFEKVEQFAITTPEESWAMHEEMINTCEDFYKGLGLPYQVVKIVSGALNNAAAKKSVIRQQLNQSNNCPVVPDSFAHHASCFLFVFLLSGTISRRGSLLSVCSASWCPLRTARTTSRARWRRAWVRRRAVPRQGSASTCTCSMPPCARRSAPSAAFSRTTKRPKESSCRRCSVRSWAVLKS
jgi:seryl-tRNA synthetase